MPRASTSKARRPRRADSDSPKPPRPLNKFFLFKQAYVAAWPEPKPENKVMVKAAGEAWKGLSPAEVAHWTKVQEEVAAEHARKYPDYKYQPTKKGDKIAARSAARRRRAEDIYSWSTPSLCASSLQSSPASSSSPLQPPSEPASPPPPSPRIQPMIWVPPTGGPNDEEGVQEIALQPPSEINIDSFECQAPQPSAEAGPPNDWAQYIDPDLLAMDGPDDSDKGLPTADEFQDSEEELQLQTQQTVPLQPRWACIDPSLLCPEGDNLYKA